MTERIFRERRTILTEKLAEAQQEYDVMSQKRLRMKADQARLLSIQRNRRDISDWTREEREFVSMTLSKSNFS